MSFGGRKAAVALWAVFAAIAAVSCVLVARRDTKLSDLHIYYGAMRHLHDGRPLYEFVAENGGPFTYPPFAAVVLWPIALVPEGLLQAAWLAATIAAIAAIGVLVGRVCGGGRPVVVAAVACGLLLSAPAQSNLRFGQVSVFIVLLALVDGIGLTPARHRGLFVGVAAAIKLTPLLFVVYFLVAGRYRDAARAGGAFVACAAVGALLLPSESMTFWTGTMADTSRIGNLASLGNQSVQGALLRLGLSPEALPLVWAVLVAVICGIALLRARQIEHSGHVARAAVLVGCATVAASPVSWTHHQIWPVLAAMLLIATQGTARRVAGVALLTAMVVSLGVVLRGFALTPGIQFALENARAVGTVGVCVLGFGGVAVAAATHRQAARRARRWAVATAAATALAVVAVQPLPAAADPTFKAYSWEHTSNPRYFYVCHERAGCADFIGPRAIRFLVTAEKTKVRVNGVVDARVGRLEYHSAPGGSPRDIPLLALYPEHRVFSFRSASLSHGRLVVYDVSGRPLVTYTSELAPPS
ncbi:glycosyltransferase 87 family protein [Micromonospora sp. CPCC 206061]|uniref:glycosyltransferase 87 family protein n=1 Tax=Micromonospora sp. CPCC 206061 TaxID=3122410 RepID=UPI002FF4251A